MIKVYIALATLFAVILACSTSQKNTQAPSAAITEPASAPSAQSSLTGWEAQWDKILKNSGKEGRVVIYTGIGSELRQDLIKAFESKYKGINLEFFAGRGPEITQKLLSENRAGLYWADIYISGATTPLTQLKPAGALVSLEPFLILPEVTNPKVWYGGEIPFIDSDKTLLAFMARPNPPVTINTRTVIKSELNSYKDLLAPKWKGKIVMDDPTAGGPGLKQFGVIGTRILNMDFWKDFAKQEPVFLRDARLAVEWVAQSKYPIGVSLQSPIVTEFQRAGAPLDQISMIEGDYLTSGFGTIASVRGAPHKNAATLFINWLLSKDGQLAWARSELRQSAREDLPIDYLDKLHTRQPGLKYVSGDDEEMLLQQPKHAELAKEIFKASLGK